MGLGNWLGGQFIDIIEWTDSNQNEVLAHRFTRQKNEIKNGAKLIVREGQSAGFVKEGQLADVKMPGMYTLDTKNMPILSTLLGWKYGFESPFKCEVYFISTRQWTDQKWGTQNPILYRDPEFGPVRLRAFGNYAFKITDPGTFLKEIVATDPSFELYEISHQFRNAIVSRFADALGTARIPMLDLAGNYEKVSKVALERIAPELAKMGIALTQFFVENVSLPPEVEAALDNRSKMAVLGNLDQYAKMQSADAIRDAAKNPGGLAGMGAGLGAGLAVGQQMGGAFAASAAAPGLVTPSHTAPLASPAVAADAPPPLPTPVAFHAAIDGASSGPHDMAALATLVKSGKLTRATLVWKTGMANWTAAETVPELASLIASVPPPLPT